MAAATDDNNLVRINMNALPLIGFPVSNRVPGPCLTIAEIFRPCIGAAWRLKFATLSIEMRIRIYRKRPMANSIESDPLARWRGTRIPKYELAIFRFKITLSPECGPNTQPDLACKRSRARREIHHARSRDSANASPFPPRCDRSCRPSPGLRPERLWNHQRETCGWTERCHPSVGRWHAGRCPAASRHREI